MKDKRQLDNPEHYEFISEVPANRNPANNPTRHEFPDDTPVSKPLRWNRQGSTLEQIRQSIGLLNREAALQGKESFEEADDFDVDDDPSDPRTRWEFTADAAYMSPEQLYQEVFKKPYQPPPVDTGAAHPTQPANPSGNNIDGGSTTVAP